MKPILHTRGRNTPHLKDMLKDYTQEEELCLSNEPACDGAETNEISTAVLYIDISKVVSELLSKQRIN